MKQKIPNQLTMARIFMIPIFVILFYLPKGAHFNGFFSQDHSSGMCFISAIVFVVASFTDWLDGYLARPSRAAAVPLPEARRHDVPVGEGSFYDLGLLDVLLRAVKAQGYTAPTPIQVAAIPHVLSKDLLGCCAHGHRQDRELRVADPAAAPRNPVRTPGRARCARSSSCRRAS